MSDLNLSLAEIIKRELEWVCDEFDPDTLALDYEDGVDTTRFCSTCGVHELDHNKEETN